MQPPCPLCLCGEFIRDNHSPLRHREHRGGTEKNLLERKLQRQLQLSWIADALSQEAVEVEQRRPAERID